MNKKYVYQVGNSKKVKKKSFQSSSRVNDSGAELSRATLLHTVVFKL